MFGNLQGHIWQAACRSYFVGSLQCHILQAACRVIFATCSVLFCRQPAVSYFAGSPQCHILQAACSVIFCRHPAVSYFAGSPQCHILQAACRRPHGVPLRLTLVASHRRGGCRCRGGRVVVAVVVVDTTTLGPAPGARPRPTSAGSPAAGGQRPQRAVQVILTSESSSGNR